MRKANPVLSSRYFPFAVFISFGYCIAIAFAAPESDLNLAMERLARETLAQLPQDSASHRVALLPMSASASELDAVRQVLTGLLTSQLVCIEGDRFVEMGVSGRQRFSTKDGLLTSEQVKRYGESLACQWLITGQVTDLVRLINVNLFLWNAHTGQLQYLANCQLAPSASLAALLTKGSAANKFHPYFLKWSSLPDMDYFVLAIETADVDGDGFNELIVADAKRLKILKWGGSNFWNHDRLPEVQYEDDETPILERARRRMLSADYDGDDRDEIYISRPPNLTRQVKWEADTGVSVTEQRPMFLAQGGERLIVGQTATDQLTYLGQSTNCWVWEAGKIRLKSPCPLPVDYHSIATRIININGSAGEIAIVQPEGDLQFYRIDYNTTRLIWQTPPIFGEGVAVGDLNGDGTPEIVGTVKQPSLQGATESIQFLDQFVVLERKGSLYTEGWKSPPLEGRIVDMKIADADNDDRNELIICVQNRQGSQIQLYAATK